MRGKNVIINSNFTAMQPKKDLLPRMHYTINYWHGNKIASDLCLGFVKLEVYACSKFYLTVGFRGQG